jgi:hypothetical protein
MANVTRKLIQFAVALASGSLPMALATTALAEDKGNVETTTQGDDYGYKFDDESLLGSTLASGGDIYKGRKRAQRVMLIRPRTDLRPEIFKSVENL